MIRAGRPLFALLLLAACQLGGPDAAATGPNPVSGDEIETSTLDAPVVGLAEEQAEQNPEPAAAETQEDVALEEPARTAPEDGAVEAIEEDVAEKAEEVDPALLTPEALACQRRGGQWSRIGSGEARACVKRTRDAGKRCDADRDCQGVCLARSGTCAPIDPLFGCNEVLQDDGRRMNLCLN